jgi:hypothetical protein
MAGQKDLTKLLAQLQDNIFPTGIKSALYIINEKDRSLP